MPVATRFYGGRCPVNWKRLAMPPRSSARCALARASRCPQQHRHCAALRDICGQTKRPRSRRRLANRRMPSPLLHNSLTRSPRRPRKMKTWPGRGLGKRRLHLCRQRVHAAAHVRRTGSQPNTGSRAGELQLDDAAARLRSRWRRGQHSRRRSRHSFSRSGPSTGNSTAGITSLVAWLHGLFL